MLELLAMHVNSSLYRMTTDGQQYMVLSAAEVQLTYLQLSKN